MITVNITKKEDIKLDRKLQSRELQNSIPPQRPSKSWVKMKNKTKILSESAFTVESSLKHTTYQREAW